MIKKIKWLFITNYGRFALGILLCLTGIFSEYSTIEFLATESPIFVYTCTFGIGIITGQFLYWIFRVIYLFFTNR